MADMSSYDHEEIVQMINDCAERESKLSDWERSFISSIGDVADKKYDVVRAAA